VDARQDPSGVAPSTAIIFVNFHSEGLIRPRAAALASQGFPVYVADNSGTYADASSTIVRPGANVGFGSAVNAVLPELPAAARVVVLHNPDVDCDAATIRDLVEVLSRQTRPGAVAPSIETPQGPRPNGFAYPSPARELFLTWRGTRPSSHRAAGRARRLKWPFGRRFASAALLVVHREALERIGGFDERYFLYGEDLDLWHRLRITGHDVEFQPDVVVHHASATGSPLALPTRELLRWVGIELYFESFSPRWWPWVRRIHRRNLDPLRSEVGELATDVGRLWERGATPSEVALQIRPLLERGLA
jgi:N-acetylglucosaminyl-diphospho-decaprenol L-rhamnosyltransferase